MTTLGSTITTVPTPVRGPARRLREEPIDEEFLDTSMARAGERVVALTGEVGSGIHRMSQDRRGSDTTELIFHMAFATEPRGVAGAVQLGLWPEGEARVPRRACGLGTRAASVEGRHFGTHFTSPG